MVEEKFDLSKYVGSKIREYRKKKKMTQKELGEKIGVKHNTVSDYESGKISPEQDMLFALSRELGVSVDEFFPPIKGNKRTDNFERALNMTNNLNLEDMDFLHKLIEKTLSLDEEEREKFLDGLRITVNYFNKTNNQ